MNMENLILIGGGVIALVIVFFAIGLTFSKLYKKASKEVAFVRTGAGGSKVVKDGGAFVLPVLHDKIEVNMNTLKLEVRKKDGEALITSDRMRVDASVDFYVRVKQDVEAIGLAAQTLGLKTTNPTDLKILIEGKLVDVLRSVASSMTMKDLHEKRSNFVQNVQNGVAKDLEQNGLELESVSLTSFDQTRREFFNPENAFDAEGLTFLTNEIETRRKTRNQIEKDNQLEIEKKNLENQREILLVQQSRSEIELETSRKIAFQTQEKKTAVEKYAYQQQQESEKVRIETEQMKETLELQKRLQVEGAQIELEKNLETKNISRQKDIQQSNIEKEKSIELTKQEKEIALASKSEARAAAEAKAQEARASLVKITEEVKTLEAVASAERQMKVEVITARGIAEKESAKIVVVATAEKEATTARSESLLINAKAEAEAKRAAAEAEANALIINAKAQSEADTVAAEGIKMRMEAEAKGRESLVLANNQQSIEILDADNRKLLISKLPEIIAESSKHLSQIDKISIIDVNGFGGVGGNGTGGSGGGYNGDGSNMSLPDQLVSASLRHRTCAGLIDNLMGEAGLSGGKNIESSIQSMLTPAVAITAPTPVAETSNKRK